MNAHHVTPGTLVLLRDWLHRLGLAMLDIIALAGLNLQLQRKQENGD